MVDVEETPAEPRRARERTEDRMRPGMEEARVGGSRVHHGDHGGDGAESTSLHALHAFHLALEAVTLGAELESEDEAEVFGRETHFAAGEL